MGVRECCEFIKNHVDVVQKEVEWAVRELSILDESNWSPETTPLIQLENSAEILRELAARIDHERERLLR